MSGLKVRHLSLYGMIVAFAILACALLVGLDTWRTAQGRERAIREDYADTANLARSIAEHAHDTMEFADSLVLQLRQRAEEEGRTPDSIARLQRSATAAIRSVRQVHALFFYGSDGNWIVNSLATPPGSLNNAAAAYFQYHRDHADRGVHVGELLRCVPHSDCTWVIPVSRRVDAPDGSFAGIVLASVSTDSLTTFYHTFDISKQGTISLLTLDGIIVARNPINSTTIGRDSSRGAVFQNLLHQAPVGSFTERFPVDHVLRLGSYHRVEGYPFIVIVAHGQRAVLAAWRRDAAVHGAISLAVASALAFCGICVARQIRRQQETEQRYRLLADNSSDAIVCLDLEGRRHYVSPAFATLTGWTAEEAADAAHSGIIHPDDTPAVAEMVRALGDREADEMTQRFRYLCKDGSNLWVEARGRFVAASHTMPAQIVANVRDISASKLAEERIISLNKKLNEQAITDGLTGLFNRRHFDEALDLEWRRDQRDRKPIGLVMIDIDRFKLYNDMYGHLQGDNALRAVASVVATFARRPGDVAARYGGEEMVLLLPGADAGGAAKLADLMRAGIEALALVHEANMPAGVVTASFGVAARWPGDEAAEGGQQALILAADRALYEAKRSGRNRVISAAPTPPTASARDVPPATTSGTFVKATAATS